MMRTLLAILASVAISTSTPAHALDDNVRARLTGHDEKKDTTLVKIIEKGAFLMKHDVDLDARTALLGSAYVGNMLFGEYVQEVYQNLPRFSLSRNITFDVKTGMLSTPYFKGSFRGSNWVVYSHRFTVRYGDVNGAKNNVIVAYDIF